MSNAALECIGCESAVIESNLRLLEILDEFCWLPDEWVVVAGAFRLVVEVTAWLLVDDGAFSWSLVRRGRLLLLLLLESGWKADGRWYGGW